MKRIAAAFALALTALGPAWAGIDLVPAFDTATGKVTITNVGDAAASISVVTTSCKRMRPAPPHGGGGCPDPVPALAAPYELPAFPNKVAIQVPPLAPGKAFKHAIAFFPGLVFASGNYAFTVRADDGKSVPESNEANNNKVFVKAVP